MPGGYSASTRGTAPPPGRPRSRGGFGYSPGRTRVRKAGATSPRVGLSHLTSFLWRSGPLKTFAADVLLLFTGDFRSVTPSYSGSGLHLGNVIIPYIRVGGLAVALVLAGILWAILNRTRTGAAILAVGADRDAAQLVGVDLRHVYALTFAIGDIHGRLDLGSPVITAWELAQAWPDGELIIVNAAGHSTGDPGMSETAVAATDRNSFRPSVPPSSGSAHRSGWGIMPNTLPRALTMPAMLCIEPLGLALLVTRPLASQYRKITCPRCSRRDSVAGSAK